MLDSPKKRVSVQSLALSCLATVVGYEPLVMRHVMPSKLPIHQLVTRLLGHPDHAVRGHVYVLIGNVIKVSLLVAVAAQEKWSTDEGIVDRSARKDMPHSV